MIVFLAVTADAEKGATLHWMTHVGWVVIDNLIENRKDNEGVKLETITLSGGEGRRQVRFSVHHRELKPRPVSSFDKPRFRRSLFLRSEAMTLGLGACQGVQ